MISSSASVLVCGAGGVLGSGVAREALARGFRVRALARSRAVDIPGVEVVRGDALRPDTLAAPFAGGVDTVFSCVGASVALTPRGWRGYTAVDTPANLNLIRAAEAAGVRRFVYVSTGHSPRMRGLAYVRAHEAVVEALRASRLDWTVVRPGGFFSALAFLVGAARKGRVPLIGDGAAKCNPIHDADLAVVCAEALAGGAREIDAGGPDVMTRRELSELACAAVPGARLRRVPTAVASLGALLLRPLHPRIAQFMRFVVALGREDLVLERRGTSRLGDYFRDLAASRSRDH